MDLDSAVVRLAAALLERLRRGKHLHIEEVGAYFGELAGERGRRNVGATLSFLYLIGAIDYRASDDVVVAASKGTL